MPQWLKKLNPLYGIWLILDSLSTQLNRIENNMPTIAEVKAAVAAAVQQVKDAINAAVTKEIAEVTEQIQALKDQIAAGGTISQSDLDEIVTGVAGIGPAATGAVDSISTSDGSTPPPPPLP